MRPLRGRKHAQAYPNKKFFTEKRRIPVFQRRDRLEKHYGVIENDAFVQHQMKIIVTTVWWEGVQKRPKVLENAKRETTCLLTS